jgi:penicillin-binding protein 1A
MPQPTPLRPPRARRVHGRDGATTTRKPRTAPARNGNGGNGAAAPQAERRSGPPRPPSNGSGPPRTPRAPSGPGRAGPKLKKVRLALILAGLSLLALISTVFGMMMAVASDLPALENQAEYAAAENSILFADGGDEIASLTGNQHRILIDESEVAPTLKNAVIAVEDRRFYEHEGVDYLGIARAFTQDVLQRSAVQGGSTITQQFVKNALAAQNDRTVFQKLRESALAYHLERQWSKQKILTQYLNTVYFGNGAYGVESAMRTYFGGGREYDAEDRLSTTIEPHEAALLAGMIASPSAYDPVQNPNDAEGRRDQILQMMLDQGVLTQAEYDDAVDQPLPKEKEIDPPELDSSIPYFSTWVTQQLVERYGAGKVFGGGLEVTTTVDPALQQSAESSVEAKLAGVGPSASVVAIENRTGEVKAMVGGENFDDRAFNLATNGHRQPGSAIKPFTLITALEQGVSSADTFVSEPKLLPNPDGPGKFSAKNYEGNYTYTTSLADATINSDNSIYAELGIQVGTEEIAQTARDMGIATPLSTNPAMTLGGLEQGVTPLEMAFAYSTLANGGVRRSGDLADTEMGPVGIEEVRDPQGDDETNDLQTERVFDEEVAAEAKELLTGAVTSGTGTAASLGGTPQVWGKTGTTENYGDGWFVGSTDQCTVAVWVGYPDSIKPMKTEYNGGPVAGGTFPAEIWHDFMAQAIQSEGACEAEGVVAEPVEPAPVDPAPVEPAPVEPVEPAPVEPVPAEPVPAEPVAPPPVEPAPPAPVEPPVEPPVP